MRLSITVGLATTLASAIVSSSSADVARLSPVKTRGRKRRLLLVLRRTYIVSKFDKVQGLNVFSQSAVISSWEEAKM